MRIKLHDAHIAATEARAVCFNLMDKFGEWLKEGDAVVQMIPEDIISNTLVHLHNLAHASTAFCTGTMNALPCLDCSSTI